MKFMRKKSFTLIEVLVAMMVFSIGTVGLYSTMMTARSAQVSAKQRLLAIRIVNEKLEEYLQVPYNILYDNRSLFGAKEEELPAKIWNFTANDNLKDYSGNFSQAFGAMIYTTIAPYEIEEDGDKIRFCRVDVTVAWENVRSGYTLSESSHVYVYDTRVSRDD